MDDDVLRLRPSAFDWGSFYHPGNPVGKEFPYSLCPEDAFLDRDGPGSWESQGSRQGTIAPASTATLSNHACPPGQAADVEIAADVGNRMTVRNNE